MTYTNIYIDELEIKISLEQGKRGFVFSYMSKWTSWKGLRETCWRWEKDEEEMKWDKDEKDELIVNSCWHYCIVNNWEQNGKENKGGSLNADGFQLEWRVWIEQI